MPGSSPGKVKLGVERHLPQKPVIPAKAGIPLCISRRGHGRGTPAFAGVMPQRGRRKEAGIYVPQKVRYPVSRSGGSAAYLSAPACSA